MSTLRIATRLMPPVLAILLAQQAFAQAVDPAPAELPATSRWRGPIAADAGLLLGLPAALETGQTAGVAAGVTGTGTLTWGARASWSRANEDSLLWSVTHNELRLRALAVLQSRIGRGTVALRLAAGGTAVNEARDRHQAARLTQSGAGLATSAWLFVPGGEVELAVFLRIGGEWGLAVAGGPSAHWVSGGLQPGWLTTLGVAWLP